MDKRKPQGGGQVNVYDARWIFRSSCSSYSSRSRPSLGAWQEAVIFIIMSQDSTGALSQQLATRLTHEYNLSDLEGKRDLILL